MDKTKARDLVKAKVGLTGTARDTFIDAIVAGIATELEDERGLVLDGTNPNHLMFVVDYSAWRYQSRDSDKGLPRHLQWRLHNLYIHGGVK